MYSKCASCASSVYSVRSGLFKKVILSFISCRVLICGIRSETASLCMIIRTFFLLKSWDKESIPGIFSLAVILVMTMLAYINLIVKKVII